MLAGIVVLAAAVVGGEWTWGTVRFETGNDDVNRIVAGKPSGTYSSEVVSAYEQLRHTGKPDQVKKDWQELHDQVALASSNRCDRMVTDDEFLGACYWLMETRMMNEIEQAAFGQIGRMTIFHPKFGRIGLEAGVYIRERFLDVDGILKPPYGGQALPSAMAIHLGIVYGAGLTSTAAGLKAALAQRPLPSLGAFEWRVVLDALSASGMSDVAYGLLLDGSVVDRGAALSWLWRKAAGIASDPTNPGFRTVIMAPQPDRRIGFVQAEYRSPAGIVKSAWRYEGDKWIWDFTVPRAAVAAVTLPGQNASRLYDAGKHHVELELVGLKLFAGGETVKKNPAYMVQKSPPNSQARAEIKWVRPICVETNRYIGWPSVCRLKNGDVVAVFSGDRKDHVCPYGKVQMVRSTDDGETWSPPQTIADGPIDDRDAGVVQLPDGEIFVFYFTSTAYRSKKLMDANPDFVAFDAKLTDEIRRKSCGNFAVWSRDNGRTWTAPQKLAIKGQSPHGPALLKDGSLLQLGRYWDSRRYTVVTAERSTDGGHTWELLCPAVPDMDNENGRPNVFHEPHAVQLADGTIIGHLRREYGGPEDYYLRQTISKDGGKTWSPMVKTPMYGCPAHLINLADGKVVSVYGRRRKRPYAECAMISDDGGVTWDAANEIILAYSADRRDDAMGYPASCVLANGDILTVYYQPHVPGELPCLMATRWQAK